MQSWKSDVETRNVINAYQLSLRRSRNRCCPIMLSGVPSACTTVMLSRGCSVPYASTLSSTAFWWMTDRLLPVSTMYLTGCSLISQIPVISSSCSSSSHILLVPCVCELLDTLLTLEVGLKG